MKQKVKSFLFFRTLWGSIATLFGILIFLQAFFAPVVFGQEYILTTPVLINSQNTTGYNTNPQNPGEFQRLTERYLEHLQIPYELIDVATQPPPDLSRRQLIISGHRGLNLSSAWQTAITNAVASGIGFVNLDWTSDVGQQAHIRTIFAATGSSSGSPGSTVTVPQQVLQAGATPHFIAALQRKFWNDPPGDIVYYFHADASGILRTVTSTVLTGASGTVLARVGTDPLIIAATYNQGRAVHFGTLEYLRADRFGFLMGMDDLFWRSLVWAARKPFVVRGYPLLWAVQMDDTLQDWGYRVRDMYDSNLTGQAAPDGTGGPWRVTGYVFISNLPPGSPERASVIADINAGRLQVFPHARVGGYGDIYWEDLSGQPLTETTWLNSLNNVQSWITGNGGADRIPFISSSMVPHFWNLSNITGYDLWNTLGVDYITEIQRPGIDFYSKTDVDRLRLRPFRLYELPPYNSLDENYPIYIADDYKVNSRSGLPPRTFFNFTTQIIDLTRYDRQDLAWPNTGRPVEQTVDQFQYYTWRLWSALAPTQIYTHDGGGGGGNYVLSTVDQRQQVIQQVSAWLNQQGVRHVFMEDLGDYMYARTKSFLTRAEISNSSLVLTYSGSTTTADSYPIYTEVLYFEGDNGGTEISVPSFTGGSTITVNLTPNPIPATTGMSPTSAASGGPGFTLTVNGTNFVSNSVVRWNGAARTTTYASSTQLTASITAADIAVVGTAQVTVLNPAPGGGTSNAQTFTIVGSNPVPTTSGLVPSSATVGGAAFALTVNGSGFINGSVVRWNGADRVTTYVSSTQLTASIPATEIAVVGTASVTVFNPAPGGGTSNAQIFSILESGSSTFFDDFNRLDNANLGNGWIEKTAGAFSLSGNRVIKGATGTGYADNLVYRPASENMLDGEASVEVRFNSLPPGYAQVFVRGQTAVIGNSGAFSGYLLYTDNDPTQARLDRIENGAFVQSTPFTINPSLNTTDTYRLRLRAMGTNPVVLAALVERLNGAAWDVIGQATVNDTAATRFTTAGTVGFSGDLEGGVYTYDNFTRVSFDSGLTNPAPVLNNISPAYATAGGPGFTLTVNGTNFVSNSVVRWNGAARTTTYVSSTQLTAAIPATDIAAVGTASVTVFNPTPGGGTSNAQIFTITASGNPVPVTTGINPTSATAGDLGFTLAVNGSGFVNGSVVRWNGLDRVTTYVSSTQLTASIPATDIAVVGTASVTVFNSAPGGGTSNAQSFSILESGSSTFFDDFNRADNANLGNGWVEKTAGAFSLSGNRVIKAATGTGYADNLVYRPASENMLDGEASVEVRFNSLPPGYAQVFVRGQTATIANSGVFSGYLLYTDNDPTQARLDRIENGAFVQSTPFTINPSLNTTDTYRLRLRAMGTNPVVLAALVERLNGAAWDVIGQATVNDTAATRFTTAGTVGFSGDLEGGVYTYDNFTRVSFDSGLTNPAPVLNSISPAYATAGEPGFTLTVNGSGFINGSVVRWNGADRATTYVSSTQLTAAIPAADIAVVGTAQVTVFSPVPGGGTSNAQSFSILELGSNSFFDDFNRPDGPNIGNGWTEKYPNAFSIQNGEVVSIDTNPIDYHDAIVYRPLSEDRRDVEVGIEFRRQSGQRFPQVHARVQRNTLNQPDTLEDYIFFVDDFEPSPGRAIIEIQPPVQGQFECYMMAIPFPSPLELGARYRLRFRVIGVDPVVLTGFVDRFDGTTWQVFASGTTTHDNTTQRNPNLYCDPGVMPPPITSAGTMGFGKWTVPNDILDNFYWVDLGTSNPVPTTSGLVPNSATTGGAAFTLTVNGTNFVSNSVVRWNGLDRTTTYVSTTQLTAAIPATDIAAVGTAQVTVFNPTPGGGTSNAQIFTINAGSNPVPTTSGLAPSSATVGGTGFTLTVNGSGFINGSVVRWNGADRGTTYVSATQLQAAILAADIVAAGTASVAAFNPAPGGGTSNAQTFTINPANNPVPTTSGLAPSSAAAGGAAFTLTVNGTSFVSNSVVRWNGTDRTTTYISATQLTAAIPATDIAVAGTASVTVFNPVPGGGTSGVQTFTINNRVPTTTSLSPTSATAGGSAFTLTVNGTNFVSGSVVRWNGADRVTTYVSATQLTAAIPASDIATAGTASVTVFNAAPGGGTSSARTFSINNPVPTTTSLSPTSAAAGGSAFTLTVNGTNFVSGSVVRWNGSNRTTTYVSATQLTAAIPASDIATARTRTVTVFNPTPGGGTSGGQTFTITTGNPVPVLSGLSPSSAAVGGSGFTLTVNGSSFVSGAVVRWNGADRVTTYVSATQLTASILAADIAAVGTASVTVFNPTPGGGTSGAQTFTISNPNPVPVATSISPTSATAGGSAFTLTVNGSSFVNGSVVRWNGSNRTTTYVSATQLTAAILAADIAAVGTASVTVFNPTPGGGTSGALTFTINNPVPVATSLNPTSAAAGGNAFTLTVNGSSFVSGAVVRWNGADRVTTYVSATQLTASILAADIAAVGAASVTVFNPTPGGGTSGALTFTITAGNPVPVLSSLSPSSAAAGGSAFTLTVNGSSFVNGSVVRWNGADRTTTYVSATQLQAAIPTTDIAAAGTASVTVFNPTPGGGTSGALTFSINSNVTVTFDNPAPSGSSGSYLNGLFQGINFGTNQWAWEGPYGSDSTNHIYFGSSSGTSRTFTFSPAPQILISIRVYAGTNGTLTLTDNLGQTRAQAITTGSMQLVTTGWTQASTTITVQFTAGWELGVDDITYRSP